MSRNKRAHELQPGDVVLGVVRSLDNIVTPIARDVERLRIVSVKARSDRTVRIHGRVLNRNAELHAYTVMRNTYFRIE